MKPRKLRAKLLWLQDFQDSTNALLALHHTELGKLRQANADLACRVSELEQRAKLAEQQPADVFLAGTWTATASDAGSISWTVVAPPPTGAQP